MPPLIWLICLVFSLALLVAVGVAMLLYKWGRTSRNMVTGLLTCMVDGLAIVDAKGTVLFLNDAAPRLLHRTRKALMGKVFIAPGTCYDSTVIDVVDTQGSIHALQIRKGAINWWGRSAWVLQFRDISETKQLELALRLEKEVIESFTRSVPGVMYQWLECRDGTCRFEYISPRHEEMFGLNKQEFEQAWNPTARLGGHDPSQWNHALQKARDLTLDWSYERTLSTPTRGTLWLRDISRPQIQNDDSVMFNGVIVDVTAQKKLVEALEHAKNAAEQSGNILERKNKQIQDSIQSAQRIQAGVMPKTDQILAEFNDAFVYLRPRDMVSGDFYWFSTVHAWRILVCADCTGHGVPGAFMTLLGNDLLSYIVNDQAITDPAEILTRVDDRLTTRMGSDTPDGMEMGVCAFSPTGSVLFAGAHLPLYIVCGDTIDVVKGNTRALGGRSIRRTQPFACHTLPHQTAQTTYYMATDGFQDQHGGRHGRKFMRNRFKQLLLRLSMSDMNKQAQLLNHEFESWRGNTPQTDDVLVIGVCGEPSKPQ